MYITLDVLRRAGVETKTVGVTGPVVTGSHGVPVTADLVIEDAVKGNDLDGVILPGGMPGTKNLEASDLVKDYLRYCRDNGLLTAAICAAPSVLGHLGYLNGKKATCFPGFETELTGAVYTADSVTETSSPERAPARRISSAKPSPPASWAERQRTRSSPICSISFDRQKRFLD